MNKMFCGALVGLVWAASWLTQSQYAGAAEIKPAADAPQPLPPSECLKHFQLPAGFRIELVAAEPHLADPVAMAFDAMGRIFVCEIHGYNLEGHLDVQELNKTGVLDKLVRRIPANPTARRRAREMTTGTLKLLEDADGDGKIDRSQVWADKLPACYGVVPARGGVIVLCAPDIIFLADRDGDGKAEVREKLFTGFGVGELWTRINNPRWGVDNWIYAASGGGSGGTIRGPKLPSDVKMGSIPFRFKPDGSRLEPISGRTSGFGLAMTDWGDRFMITNSAHALLVMPLPYRYLARNPYVAAPEPMVNIADYYQVFPTSQPHPWRTRRSEDPKWVKFYGEREATANGYFTAACSPMVYRATAFGPEYYGNHFTCESSRNMVHRCLLLRDGAGYRVKRAPGREKVEFLTSSDQWFRPVNLAVGPDGALYIVDMYREIIEDYSAIPRYLQQQYGLIKGNDRGRIWRVVAEAAPKPRRPRLAEASTAQLVAELSHENAWWRQTAQRLLVERGDKSVVGSLATLVREGTTAQARLHALSTLDGLGALEPAIVEASLNDTHFGVRLHALRLCERWLDSRPKMIEKIVAMADDPDPQVRLQVALTLGETRQRQALEALTHLAKRQADQRWMQAAILSSVRSTSGELLEALLRSPNDSDKGRLLVGPLASIVGARQHNEEIGRALRNLAQAEEVSIQLAGLKGLSEGLHRGKRQTLSSPDGQGAIRRLLASSSGGVRKLALEVAGLVKLKDSPLMTTLFAEAKKQALDGDLSVRDRQAAIALLTAAPYTMLAATARELLDSRQPPDVQLSAVAALSASDDTGVGTVLLANWKSFTPPVQTAVIDALFARQNRLTKLLDAVETGIVQPASLGALGRVQLLENPDGQIRQRAQDLLAKRIVQKDRQQVIERYRAALSAERDLQKGQTVFEKRCAKCHKIKGQGAYQVGPDLTAANNRADETLLTDILSPSARITAGFRSYTIATTDGRIVSGVLAAETATSITLRREEGAENTILRKNIDAMSASDVSLMPENIEREISPQDLAAVIAYLRQRLGPPSPAAVTLFEDDLAFLEALREGSGKISFDLDDRFSGTAALAVTPLQRYSPRIRNWRYRIVEKPGPGEFRYLRLAWKSRGGEGVMIELAADGNWPPADKPLRRYYSGENTTKWQARQVSARVPRQWSPLTVDLWKDCGEFTLTGIAPTAMGGTALFDHIELLRSLDDVKPSRRHLGGKE